jgi:hypothetical protein
MSGRAEFEPIPHTPLLHRVNYPVIEVKDRKISVRLDDADEKEIELTFQPYQALKLTTIDCYLSPQGQKYSHNQMLYVRTSEWIEELKSALRVIDKSANFMDKAVHFIIPAGDDVLEVAAWKVEIKYQNQQMTYPDV